jgi:hypothetical protein
MKLKTLAIEIGEFKHLQESTRTNAGADSCRLVY